MFSWLKKKLSDDEPPPSSALPRTVRHALPEGDDETVRIVVAVAGLLVCVAYADMHYADREEAVLADTLRRVRGVGEQGVQAILEVVRQQCVTIASREASSYARELLELSDEAFRLELLDVLVDLAAADDEITVAETNMMRSVARSLGLTQAQYNAAQRRHRDKLAVLKV